MWQRAETQRASTLMTVVGEIMGDTDRWPKEVRMEELITAASRATQRVASRQLSGKGPMTSVEGFIQASSKTKHSLSLSVIGQRLRSRYLTL